MSAAPRTPTANVVAVNVVELVAQAGARPRPATRRAAVVVFAWRALLKLRHVPEQLGDVLGIPVIFTLMFTYLFGGALAGSTGTYLQFLLPGTMSMAVVLVTVYAGTTLRADISTGAFDRFRALPIWRPAPIVGAMVGDVGRYVLAAGLVVGMGLAIGFDAHGGIVGVAAAVGLAVVFAVSLSWVWTALALLVRTSATVQTAGLLVLFPLTFASNVFVDPRTMPGWERRLIDLNPLTHLVSAARGLMLGTPAASDCAWVLVASAAITAVFAPLTMRLLRHAS